ncbi:MAG: hypothetical protein HZA66_22125 [Rhodopseudomonas palustris]|uniref:Porin n=1 Tax=Rhodopseudomonas palustris TaxID=1076 RepID=A0A933S1U0_RHOPL|nr:hypothetical protein [Rhodopseudomonas palustris]
MRQLLIALAIAALPVAASAQGLSRGFSDASPADRPAAKPLAAAPKQTRSNPCAAFGAGFVQVEGSTTCVKLGGGIDVGVGGSSRR